MLSNNKYMPTISQNCEKEIVFIKYRDASGKVIGEIVRIDSSYHSYMKAGEPFKIASKPDLIGLVDMPGSDGGLWAVSSKEEFRELSAVAEMKRQEIAEAEAWKKIVEEEENSYHRNDAMSRRRTDIVSRHKNPGKRVIIYYTAFETNRKRH